MKYNKFFLISALIFISLIFLFGCSQSNSKSDLISLYDYNNITISKDYIEISQEDIETIIQMDFLSNDFYRKSEKSTIEAEDVVLLSVYSENSKYCFEDYYYEVGTNELTENFDRKLIGLKATDIFDFVYEEQNSEVLLKVTLKGIFLLHDATDEQSILDFYDFQNITEAYKYIKNRATEEIIFNYMWEEILENSKIFNLPENYEMKISSAIEDMYYKAEQDEKNITEFLCDLGTTLEEFEQVTYNYYSELFIAECVLSENSVEIDSSCLLETKKHIAEKNNIYIKELEKYFSEDEIYYQTVMNKLKEILIQKAIIVN